MEYQLYFTTVAIPMFPELEESEVEYVVGKIKEFFKK
jgi:dTDP-4-amino-4,6-dideoxygalactose transaminase